MTKEENFVFAAGKSNWKPVSPGIHRQILAYDDKIMMVKVKFEKGGVGGLHNHLQSQVTHVVKGTFEMTIGENKHIIKEGDSFFVPPFITHGCVCLEEGLLLDVFSPPREEFLTEE